VLRVDGGDRVVHGHHESVRTWQRNTDCLDKMRCECCNPAPVRQMVSEDREPVD